MTTKAQKAEERRVLLSILEMLGVHVAEEDIFETDPPDFVIELCGKKVGVEVRRYHDQRSVAPSKFPRPMVESAWQRFRTRALELARHRPELRGVDVWLSFYPLELPRERDWNQIIDEIAHLVTRHRHALRLERTEFSGWETGTPLLQKHVNSVRLADRGRHADWHWNGTSAFIGPPTDADMQALFAEKASKGYPALDELWLIVYGGSTISRTFPGTDDLAVLQSMTAANSELSKGPFSRAILWDPFRSYVFQWTERHGWRKRSQSL